MSDQPGFQNALAAWLECVKSGRLPARRLHEDGSAELVLADFVAWAGQRWPERPFTEADIDEVLDWFLSLANHKAVN